MCSLPQTPTLSPKQELQQQSTSLVESKRTATGLGNNNNINNSNSHYTFDLIQLYTNLNEKYRLEAYDSLDLSNQIPTQSIDEFKLKLLFSVIVVGCFTRMVIHSLNIASLIFICFFSFLFKARLSICESLHTRSEA
jgi:hypothetical protein